MMVDWLALALTPGIGPARFSRVRGNAPAPSRAAVETLLSPELGLAFSKTQAGGEAEEMLERAERKNAQVLLMGGADYPEPLLHLAQPPLFLLVRGSLAPLGESIAVVGTRRASPWALSWTRRVAGTLAEAGLTVVSGLAHGIDAAAHQGALEGEGTTVAVLGSGLDHIYPRGHEALAERCQLVSEHPFGTAPRPEFFPRRNRIIAALSTATLVVEGRMQSGAMITASLALELGREVLAVPGRPTDPGSEGPNRLIKDGAGLVLDISEVLDALGLQVPSQPPPKLQEREARLYQALLEQGEALPDELAESTKSTPSEVFTILALLELKGLVQRLPGGRFLAAR